MIQKNLLSRNIQCLPEHLPSKQWQHLERGSILSSDQMMMIIGDVVTARECTNILVDQLLAEQKFTK